MVNIHPHADALSRAQARLDEIEVLLRRPASVVTALSPDGVVQEDLRARIQELTAETVDGLHALSDYAGAAGGALAAVRARFDDADADATQVMQAQLRAGGR